MTGDQSRRDGGDRSLDGQQGAFGHDEPDARPDVRARPEATGRDGAAPASDDGVAPASGDGASPDPDGDPRCHETFVRRLPAARGSRADERGDVVLLGVVHDHPASAHRVSSFVDAADPDVVALELAPLAVPAYARLARDAADVAGGAGEMRAAIEAAGDARVVGIDGPSLPFLRSALATSARRDASVRTVARLVARFARVGGHCAASRVRSGLRAAIGRTPDTARLPGGETEHDVDADDPPAEQAAHERSQVRRAAAIGSALEAPPAAAYRDATREAHMARRLRDLRTDGDVVAVVGAAHLDEIARRLESS